MPKHIPWGLAEKAAIKPSPGPYRVVITRKSLRQQTVRTPIAPEMLVHGSP